MFSAILDAPMPEYKALPVLLIQLGSYQARERFGDSVSDFAVEILFLVLSKRQEWKIREAWNTHLFQCL
jgi:hypothetical protein